MSDRWIKSAISHQPSAISDQRSALATQIFFAMAGRDDGDDSGNCFDASTSHNDISARVGLDNKDGVTLKNPTRSNNGIDSHAVPVPLEMMLSDKTRHCQHGSINSDVPSSRTTETHQENTGETLSALQHSETSRRADIDHDVKIICNGPTNNNGMENESGLFIGTIRAQDTDGTNYDENHDTRLDDAWASAEKDFEARQKRIIQPTERLTAMEEEKVVIQQSPLLSDDTIDDIEKSSGRDYSLLGGIGKDGGSSFNHDTVNSSLLLSHPSESTPPTRNVTTLPSNKHCHELSLKQLQQPITTIPNTQSNTNNDDGIEKYRQKMNNTETSHDDNNNIQSSSSSTNTKNNNNMPSIPKQKTKTATTLTTTSKTRTSTTLLQKYRTLLQKHEPSLNLLEHVMERFVFYRLFFKHDHRGIRTELYYAAWNVIRWINDVVLVGWGEGMGLTVGKREEWLVVGGDGGVGVVAKDNTKSSRATTESMQDVLLSKLTHVVPLLRAILTATTCIYPAMEAWSRSSLHSHHPSRYGYPLLSSYGVVNAQAQQQQQYREEYEWAATTTDPSPRKRHDEWERRQSHAAHVSYRLERVRFCGRLALLLISWWARQRRTCLQNEENENNNNDSGIRQVGRKIEKGVSVPSLLRRGGELDPYESMIPLEEAEDEAKVVHYVGRRTGRRSVARASGASQMATSRRSNSGSRETKRWSFVRWLSDLVSAKNNILYVYAVGELLHILRPLYWSNTECNAWKRRSFKPMNELGGKRNTHRGSSYSLTIWKGWWISLIMDLVSDKLLQMTLSEGDSPRSNTTKIPFISSFLSLVGGRNSTSHSSSSSSPSPAAEQAMHHELEDRRSRHRLYLLRSPVYNSVTLPVATLIGRILTMLPTFGLGRWAAEYMLDMMSYWNEHRFMLES